MHWDDAEWEPWRPEDAARLLASVDVPWAAAAGWAIDLFLGAQRRDHEDLELGIPEQSFPAVAAQLPMLEFFVVARGVTASVEGEPERLTETHQTWGSFGRHGYGDSISSESPPPTAGGSAGGTSGSACPTRS